MTEYRGYEIPDSLDEFLKNNMGGINGLQLPMITYNPVNSIPINTTIPINYRDYTEEEQEAMLNTAIHIMKEYINQYLNSLKEDK